jgi:PAS domain S-box-containing protein
MAKSGGRTDRLRELRNSAEQKIRNRIVTLRSKPGIDNERLIQELQIHEVELEMQNEELRRAQLDLETVKAKYFGLFDLAPVGYFTLDEKGLVVDVNLAGAALFGAQERDMIGRAFSRYVSADSQDRYYLCRTNVPENGARQTCELKLHKDNGEEFHGQWIGTALASEQPDSSRFRVTIIDISERKQAEEKVREYQARLKAMAGEILLAQDSERRRIATRFDNNIAQKLAHTKLMLESSLPLASVSNVSASIKKACEAMGQMIEEAETFMFELSDPILHELGFAAALDRYLAEEIERKHGIAYKFESDKPSDTLASEVRTCLFRIVRELLVNVVKHSKAHKINVSIHRHSGRIVLHVQDDGVGFNVRKLDSAPGKPARYGLFGIREQLDRLGGRLEIKSEPGRGTAVTVVVPIGL